MADMQNIYDKEGGMEQSYFARQPRMDLCNNPGRFLFFSIIDSFSTNWRLVQQLRFTFKVTGRYRLQNKKLLQQRKVLFSINKLQQIHKESSLTELKDRLVGFEKTNLMEFGKANDDGPLQTMGVNVRQYRRLSVSRLLTDGLLVCLLV